MPQLASVAGSLRPTGEIGWIGWAGRRWGPPRARNPGFSTPVGDPSPGGVNRLSTQMRDAAPLRPEENDW